MLANYLIEDFLSLSFLFHTEFFSVNERQRNYICLSLRRIRIAQKEMEEVKLHIYSADTSTMVDLSFVDGGIKAGFPSPAQDYLSESIDLNKELIRRKETTFLARVSGNSLVEAGICDGDMVVIDKSLEAKNGDFVVAFIDGEFTLKEFRYDESGQCAWLIPHNKDFSPIKVTAENDFMIWGVLTYTIKQLRK